MFFGIPLLLIKDDNCQEPLTTMCSQCQYAKRDSNCRSHEIPNYTNKCRLSASNQSLVLGTSHASSAERNVTALQPRAYVRIHSSSLLQQQRVSCLSTTTAIWQCRHTSQDTLITHSLIAELCLIDVALNSWSPETTLTHYATVASTLQLIYATSRVMLHR